VNINGNLVELVVDLSKAGIICVYSRFYAVYCLFSQTILRISHWEFSIFDPSGELVPIWYQNHPKT